MRLSCLAITPKIQSLIDNLQKKYPQYTQKDLETFIVGTSERYGISEPAQSQVEKYIEKRESPENLAAISAAQKEMQAIKEQAIKDGTFMKAPNGKPTNLTERQWLQVRTKAFKEWFGDWEKAAPSEKLTDEDKRHLSRFFKVLPEYSDIFNNDVVLLNQYLKSIFPNSKYRKFPFLHRSKSKINKFEIKEGRNLANAIWFTGRRNYGNRDVESYPYLTVALLNLENPIIYDDSGAKVNTPEKYKQNVTDLGYDSVIFEPTHSQGKNELDQIVVNDLNRIYILGTKEDLQKAKNFVNSSSKVVDENGEPLVVYHGTPNGEFSEFSYNYIHPDDGFYFAEDQERAVVFEGSESIGDNPYMFKVFLNIRNPKDLGNNVIHNTVRQAFTVDYKGEDGAVGLDAGTKHKVWVIMRPNQVKSAEYNIGTYSPENNDIAYSSKEEESQVIKGQLGVNKKQLISLLGSTMYQQGRQGVAIKELLQNAFDAVKIAESKGQIKKGKINITLDKNNRTVKVSDNGTGMTPEIVQKAFFTIGGSYKGDAVDNRLKSGGLGLAKMAFLFGSDYVEVSTVKDGIKTYVKATPSEIENDNFNIVTSKTSEPNGTTVEVKIPEYYLDNNGEKRTIWFESKPSFLSQPMIGNVDLTVTKKGFGWYDNNEETVSEDKSLIPEGYISIGRATSAFGDIDIMISPKSSGSTTINPKILISGLHQFNDWVNLNNSKARFDVILNILPKVGVQDELYPINNQREGFRATIKPEVEDIHYLIKKINNILERKSVASAFGRTISMTAANVSDVKRETPLTLQDTATEIKKEIFKLDSPTTKSFTGDDILKVLSLSSVREDRENSRHSSFDSSNININGDNSKLVVDTSSLNLNKPVFHNNTTMQIEEDGQKVITSIGELLLELKSLYSQTYKNSKITTGYEKGYENIVDYISKQYWGISFDKGYGGVNVNPKLMPLLAINPFYTVSEYEGVDTALVLTEYITHLIIHEFNHNYASGEGAEFTGRFPQTYGEFAGIGTQFTKDWKNKLYILIRDNLGTFKKYAERYKESENIGESFDGEQITERPSSKEEGSDTDGINIQGDRSGENVQENGGEFDVISEQIQRFQQKQQPTTITYTPVGKETQTYTVQGSHIYNKEGKEVFKEDSKDRNKIFANLAVKNGTAVVVEYKGTKYIVNNRGMIMTTSKTNSGAIMQWGPENGDRKAIMAAANEKFAKLGQQQNNLNETLQNPINIWAGSNEHTELSNMAIRPFTIPMFNPKNPNQTNLQLNSVEQGFQLAKFDKLVQLLSTGNTQAFNTARAKAEQVRDQLMTITSPFEAKKLGSTRITSKSKEVQEVLDEFFGTKEINLYGITREWRREGVDIMKNLIKESFKQNPEALQKLLDTGNAILTHNQATDSWKTEFPRILMEVRDELRGTQTLQQASQLQIIESGGGYPQRTKENADWSDITLDFTETDKGSGGLNELTKRVAGNKYVHFKMHDEGEIAYDADEILNSITKAGLPTKNIKLNIAGSEIGKLKHSQETYNDEVERIIKDLQRLGVTISEIRSGGQTGIDEAGIVAAQRLGIPASVNAPKGFAFRDKSGKDIYNREQFLARFGQQQVTGENISSKGSAISNNTQKQEQQIQKKVAPKPVSKVELSNISRSKLSEDINRVFGNSRIKDARVMAIATTFSDAVDMLIEDEEENTGNKVTNRQKFIIEHLRDILGYTEQTEGGEPRFVDGILTDYFNPNNPDYADDDYVRGELEKFSYQTNPTVWMALLEEAAPAIQQYEGIVLNTRNRAAVNNEGQIEDDWEADGENILSLKDGWMIKAREIDLRDALSQKTRRLLSRVKEAIGYDEQGEPRVQYDDLGFTKYLNPDYAHLKLLGVLSNATDSNKFDELLENMAKKESWVKYLLNEFKRDPSIKSAFYGDLRKEFIPYWIHFKSAGKVLTKQLNYEPSILYYMKEWEHNYNGHIQLSDNSIYNTDGSINNDNIDKTLSRYESLLNSHIEGWDTVSDTDVNVIKSILEDIGIGYTTEELSAAFDSSDDAGKLAKDILAQAHIILNGIRKNGITTSPLREYKKAYSSIAELLDLIPQAATMAAFMENGKNYQSYANPSWIGTWINNIHGEDAVEYLTEEYGRYKQFFKDGQWRGPWLRLMMGKDGEVYRKMLERKVVLKSEDKEYMDWSDKDYFDVIFREFLSTNNKNTAYYYLPILADAPSAEFIKFVRYSGKNYKENILDGLWEVFAQEVERIFIVNERSLTDGVYKIQNFDKYGKQFNFFPSLNAADAEGRIPGEEGYDSSKSFAEAYNEKLAEDVNNKNSESPTSYAKELAIKAIRLDMERGFRSFKQEAVEYGYKPDNTTLEEFYWNNALAYTQIVTLTTTDLAYYKGVNDFQKRYKEVYSMTRRLYENATYLGTDELVGQRDEGGVYEVVVTLKDIEFPSTVFNEISSLCDNKVSQGLLTKDEADYIKSQMLKINTADAQAIRSLDSYRDILTMSGDWTEDMETAYKHLTEDDGKNWTVEDFNVLWLTIKPFLFGMKSVDSQVNGPDGLPYGELRVPIQFKNSEMLLLSLYSKIAEAETKSPLLKALAKVMNGEATGGKKISVIQFESSEKAGGQAAIDLNGTNLNDENEILNTFKVALNKQGGDLNEFVAKKIYMKYYGIQVTSPEHLYDHQGIIQSQFKKHIMANLPAEFEITIQGKKMNGRAVYDTMQEILTENIISGFETCEEIFGSKEAVERELQKSMAGNTRYTEEDRRACTLFTDANGEKQWSTLLFDPVQSQRIQQLLMSIIKSKVTKQSSRRSYLVQATGVGFSDDLHIRFYDTEGHFIFNEKEFNGIEKCRPIYQKQLDYVQRKYKGDYAKYASENKADPNAIAYHEIAMPPYSRDIVDAISDEQGNMDITKLPDELRVGLTLRSPNEAKYSTQPVYIKYFLPRNNGGIIMHPVEITKIVGADFDYDKMMTYFPEIRVTGGALDAYRNLSKKERDMWEGDDSILIDFLADVDLEVAPELHDTSLQQILTTLGAEEGRELVGFKAWLSYQKDMNPEEYERLKHLPKKVEKVKYSVSKPISEQSVWARNNMYFDIAFNVLTDPSVAGQMVSPGNYDELKRQVKIKRIQKEIPLQTIKRELGVASDNINDILDALYKIKEEKAKELLEKYQKVLDPKSVSTQIYFHRKNANAGKMIGIYAVAGAAHSLFQNTSTTLNAPTDIMGVTVTIVDPVYEINNPKRFVSKNIEQFTAASVDDVKDPVLSDLNQDPKTGDVTNTMLRLGFDIEKSINVVSATAYPAVGNKEKLTAQITPTELRELVYYQLIDNFIPSEHLNYMANKGVDKVSTLTDAQRRRMNELMKRMYVTDKVIQKISKDLSSVTLESRGDSPKNSGGPTIGDAIARLIKLYNLFKNSLSEKFTIHTDIFNWKSLLGGNSVVNEIIDYVFDEDNYKEEKIRANALSNAIPFIEAATKCGVIGPLKLLKAYFPQLNASNLKLLLNESYGLMSYIRTEHRSQETIAKTVNKFFNDFYIYALNDTDFFGKTTDSKGNLSRSKLYNAAYYMLSFPEQVMEYVNSNEDLVKENALLSNLEFPIKNGVRTIAFKDAKDLSKADKQRVSDSWLDLVISDNEELQTLGYQLFKYGSFMGLSYSGPKSFIHLAPAALRESVNDYYTGLSTLITTDSVDYGLPFVEQFIRNNYEMKSFLNVVKGKDLTSEFDENNSSSIIVKNIDAVTVDTVDIVREDDIVTEPVLAKMIVFTYKGKNKETKNKLYTLTDTTKNSEGKIDGASYSEVQSLGVNGFREYYNGVEDPQSVLEYYEKPEYSEQLITESNSSSSDDIDESDQIVSSDDEISQEDILFLQELEDKEHVDSETSETIEPASPVDPDTNEPVCGIGDILDSI